MFVGSAGAGARGGDDGRVHSHGREPHVAAPVGARAGVGQPVHRGSEEEQPEALKLEGIARGPRVPREVVGAAEVNVLTLRSRLWT